MVEKLQVSFPAAKVAPPAKDGVSLVGSRVIVDFNDVGKAHNVILNYNVIASDNTVIEKDNITVKLPGGQADTLTTVLLSALKTAIEGANGKVLP